ncbi:MAG: UvrD-helicase domain-containing protein [Thermoguttaceae bacterium]|nr:UvrD-helicase domain-containing protein [Thermoguttaceae bacterium]
MQLNPEQIDAVRTTSGPLLVLAGAGTGKTRVVTERIAQLIRLGIRPERILAVTFTNKAAREMQQRVAARLGRSTETRPEISTFHSLCVRILRRQIQRLGYPSQFIICDRGDQESIAREVLQKYKTQTSITPGDLVNRISRWKCAAVRSHEALNHLDPDSPSDYIFAMAYGEYQKQLKLRGAVDFDDLLLLTEEVFAKYPEALKAESGRFDHILVDEYQDTNLSQYRIIKALAERHKNLCVVGDDDQAIYAWRGAEVEHILRFGKDWPGTKTVRLVRNYRSTQPILDWANRLIHLNQKRHPKRLISPSGGDPPFIETFEDDDSEAAGVVENIYTRLHTEKGLKPGDIAILFRTNEQPRPFELHLRVRKIPYVVVGGQSFFDRKETRDIISYLKLFHNPNNDLALLRIINTPKRGIGETTIQRIRESASKENISLWKALCAQADQNDKLNQFRAMMERYSHLLRRQFTVDNVRGFIEAIEYEKEIERLFPGDGERQRRMESLADIVNAVGSYLKDSNEETSLWGFLDQTSLGEPDFGKDKEERLGNAVTLMTLHAAKGLEFREVYMVGMEEGLLPHKRSILDLASSAIEEERRLCYVGVTRAKRRLTLTMAKHRLKWGKMRQSIPSRFLFELTGDIENPTYIKILSGAFDMRSTDPKNGSRPRKRR